METRTRSAQDARSQGLAGVPGCQTAAGALANSRGHRHEENAARLVNAGLEMPIVVGAALLASAEGYTAREQPAFEAAREARHDPGDRAPADDLPGTEPGLVADPAAAGGRKKKSPGAPASQRKRRQRLLGKRRRAQARQSGGAGASRQPRRRRSRRQPKQTQRRSTFDTCGIWSASACWQG